MPKFRVVYAVSYNIDGVENENEAIEEAEILFDHDLETEGMKIFGANVEKIE